MGNYPNPEPNEAQNEPPNIKTLINLYFRGDYFIFVPIVLSILFRQSDYLYWIFNLILKHNFNSLLLLVNIIGLYIILYKIKITFSINYN